MSHGRSLSAFVFAQFSGGLSAGSLTGAEDWWLHKSCAVRDVNQRHLTREMTPPTSTTPGSNLEQARALTSTALQEWNSKCKSTQVLALKTKRLKVTFTSPGKDALVRYSLMLALCYICSNKLYGFMQVTLWHFSRSVHPRLPGMGAAWYEPVNLCVCEDGLWRCGSLIFKNIKRKYIYRPVLWGTD